MPKNLEDLLVYRKANKVCAAVSAILRRKNFNKHSVLKDQLARSSMSVGPLIAEGFGQLTDRHLATYLGRARGSVFESIGHLHQCLDAGLISRSEHADLVEEYDHTGKMLTRWISYLQRTDWKVRS